MTVEDVLAELASLEDPRMRAVNERHGDDHGVNLTALRALAQRIKGQQDLARELWRTGDTAARLVGRARAAGAVLRGHGRCPIIGAGDGRLRRSRRRRG